MEKAIVLMSGGLDSAVTLAIAATSYECFPLGFDYGQTHRKELESAKKLVNYMMRSGKSVNSYKVVKIDGLDFADSSLVGGVSPTEGVIPGSYVPARNAAFLSIAVGFAESKNASVVFAGMNHDGPPGVRYPDCSRTFVDALEKALQIGTRRGTQDDPVRIITPIVDMAKGNVVRLGKRLDIPFELTWTCYEDSPKPCGACLACQTRAIGFKDAELVDPLLVRR